MKRNTEKHSKAMTMANSLVKQGIGRSAAMIKAWTPVKLSVVDVKTAGVTHGKRQRALARLERCSRETLRVALERDAANTAPHGGIQTGLFKDVKCRRGTGTRCGPPPRKSRGGSDPAAGFFLLAAQRHAWHFWKEKRRATQMSKVGKSNQATFKMIRMPEKPESQATKSRMKFEKHIRNFPGGYDVLFDMFVNLALYTAYLWMEEHSSKDCRPK
jgi:hypothetical protein